MAVKKKVSKQVSRVITQAKSQAWENLKLLEALEKETVAKARNLIKLPTASERKRMTNEKILTSLRKLGVATQEEVLELKKRIEELESALAAKIGSARTIRATASRQPTEGAIPQS